MIHLKFPIFSNIEKFLFGALLCSVVLCSCTNEEEDTFSANGQVQFTSSLLPSDDPETRVYDQTWTCNERVGVAMFTAGGALSGGFTEYKPVGTSGARTVDFTAVGTGYYYPLNPTAKVNFIAYSPYSGTASATTVTYGNMHLQSTKALMENVDFIYHKGTTPYDRTTTGKVDLKFDHKFSKIVVNVSRSAIVNESMTELEVTINNIPASATCNLVTGAVTGVGALTTLTLYRASATATNVTFEAIVAPNKVGTTTVYATPTRTITIRVKSGSTVVQTFTKTITDTFESGKRYIYNYNISAVIDASKVKPESNCYIVAPGEEIWIPMSRVQNYRANYADATPSVTFNDTDVFTTELLWSDVKDLVTHKPMNRGYSKGYVRVTAAAGKTGNAVVVAKKGGVVLWSWHIWVVSGVGTKTGGGLTWLDRNLGATSATPGDANTIGCHYQWGRKDPFPGPASFANTNRTVYLKDGSSTDEVSIELTTKQESITCSVEHPDKFFGNSTDWCSTDQSTSKSRRWYNVNTKSIDDPCPPGYMVLLDVNWDFLTTDNFKWTTNGRSHSTAGYYPTVGYRGAEGLLLEVGNRGHYWSATPNPSVIAFFALNLYFENLNNNTFIYMSTRAYGYGVRCRQE